MVVDLRASRNLESLGQLDEYVAWQRTVLDSKAALEPDRLERAGINLKKHLSEAELESILDQYDLQWANVYWEASNGVHGAIAEGIGQQSLSELEKDLRERGDLGAADSVLGAYYIAVLPAPLKVLQALDQEENVVLVDVGPLDKLDDAAANPSCVIFDLPDPLWYDQLRLAQSASQ